MVIIFHACIAIILLCCYFQFAVKMIRNAKENEKMLIAVMLVGSSSLVSIGIIFGSAIIANFIVYLLNWR